MTKEEKPKSLDSKEDDSVTITLSKNQIIGILLPFMFVLGLVSGYFLWEFEKEDKTQTVVFTESDETELPDTSPDGFLDVPAFGPEDAPITIVEYSDFECPFCQRHFQQTYSQILDAYPGQIRYEFKHFPLSFHQNAVPAAVASMCAHEQGEFWAYHDYLFSNELGLDKEAILTYAERLELDMDEFNACMEEMRYSAQVQADMQEGEARGVGGTPSFFINDVYLEGAYPFEEFARIIDAELSGTSDSGGTGQTGQVPPSPTQESPRYEEIVILDTDPTYGPEDAPITIIEFSDFECSFCQRHFQQTYSQINDTYGEDIRYVFKHFPLTSIHPNALPASNASLCAHEQGEFWAYHDYLFSGELELGQETYLEYAQRLSLDMDDFTTCVVENRYEAQILEEMQTAVTSGVHTTPTFFVNGIAVEGAYPFETFAEIIDAELAAAEGD